jgi:hypothetical protein
MSISFIKRASSSLGGNILLWELIFSLPLFLIFLWKNGSEGNLTFGWAIHIALACSVMGALAATFFWFFVALALSKSRDVDRQVTKRRK